MLITTHQVIIIGLYIAFFNRAPDEEGLNFWVNRASDNPLIAINELAAGFASHPKFTELYDALNNQAFVEAIYINILGASGDTEGIAFWTDQINNGQSRSDMVAEFIFSALSFNQDDVQWDSLTTEEKAIAQVRQDTLNNKIEAGLYFTEKYGEASNITAPDDLDNDLAYLKSIAVLQDVDNTPESVLNAKSLVDNNIIYLAASEPLFHQGIDGVADTFIYEIDSSNFVIESRETGNITITGFNVTEDKLVFQDVDSGTTSTAFFTEDALISSDTSTQIIFEDIVIAEEGFSLVLTGITDFSSIDFLVA